MDLRSKKACRTKRPKNLKWKYVIEITLTFPNENKLQFYAITADGNTLGGMISFTIFRTFNKTQLNKMPFNLVLNSRQE